MRLNTEDTVPMLVKVNWPLTGVGGGDDEGEDDSGGAAEAREDLSARCDPYTARHSDALSDAPTRSENQSSIVQQSSGCSGGSGGERERKRKDERDGICVTMPSIKTRERISHSRQHCSHCLHTKPKQHQHRRQQWLKHSDAARVRGQRESPNVSILVQPARWKECNGKENEGT